MLVVQNARDPEVLWDVVEEHLAEAAFGLEQLERAFDHPARTLSELDRYPEARLLAHIDALVVGGEAVERRLLVPAVEAAEEELYDSVTAAALALLVQGRHERLWPAFTHAEPRVRKAVVRACALGGGGELDRWAGSRLQAASTPAVARASLLELHAARRLPPPSLIAELQSDDPELVRAAARAARRAEPQLHLPVMEYLLAHDDTAVREAALIATLSWGSAHAARACERFALDAEAPSPLAMALYVFGHAQHARLAEQQLARPRQRKHALFALGFSGNAALVPQLLEFVASEDALERKLAAQAIATITGLDLLDDAFVVPEPVVTDTEASELPLEDDDLDAELVPMPEDALPSPNAAAIADFLHERRSHFDPGRRYLEGAPLNVAALLDVLERRHFAAATSWRWRSRSVLLERLDSTPGPSLRRSVPSSPCCGRERRSCGASVAGSEGDHAGPAMRGLAFAG